MADEQITTKQVVVVMQVDIRVDKKAIETALEKLTPHFRHPTAWDSLVEFLEDLPDIEWDDDDDDEPHFPPVYGHA